MAQIQIQDGMMVIPAPKVAVTVPSDYPGMFITYGDDGMFAKIPTPSEEYFGFKITPMNRAAVSTPGRTILREVMVSQTWSDRSSLIRFLAFHADITGKIIFFEPVDRQRQYLSEIQFIHCKAVDANYEYPSIVFIFAEGSDDDMIPLDLDAAISCCAQHHVDSLRKLWSYFYNRLSPETRAHLEDAAVTYSTPYFTSLCELPDDKFPERLSFKPFSKRKKRTGKKSDSFKYPFGLNILGDLKDLLFGKKE